MKAILFLAVIGLAVAGCGSGKKAGSSANPVNGSVARSITVVGASPTTIPDVKTGTQVSCQGWPKLRVKVPPPGGGVNGDGGQGSVTPSGTGASSSISLQLKHLPNGSITVSCRSTSG